MRLVGLCLVYIQFVVFFGSIRIHFKAYSDQSILRDLLPLSASCDSSRAAVIAQNITRAPPIGSRYDGLSLLASEIESISHIPRERQIVIKFYSSGSSNSGNHFRRRICNKPFVIGRLSGPYLSMIDNWTPIFANNIKKSDQSDHNETSREDVGETVDQLVGEYNVPFTGQYFLEIIGLLCNDLHWNEDYKNVCLEDYASMQLTGDSASINIHTLVTTPNEFAGSTDVSDDLTIGHWKWVGKETSGLNSDRDSDIQYIPLHTRYQPPSCRDKIAINETCKSHMSLDRFEPYQFQFHFYDEPDRVRSRALAITNNSSNDGQTQLCFVGLSHAREMAAAVNVWLQQWSMSNIVAKNYDAQFPRLINENFIQKIIIGRGCTKTVIAAGQWSAGRKPPGGKYRNVPPTPFSEYEEEVRGMILALKASQAKGIYLRSIHYNSLGDVKLTCPPQDWRHPPVIDRYNGIIRNLTTQLNISFIDTSPIIAPMWDSAGDFCHYRDDKVSSAEALYVLSQLL